MVKEVVPCAVVALGSFDQVAFDSVAVEVVHYQLVDVERVAFGMAGGKGYILRLLAYYDYSFVGAGEGVPCLDSAHQTQVAAPY